MGAMKSWKARLLVVFTVGALTLADSVPAMAYHPGGATESMFGADGLVSGEVGRLWLIKSGGVL